MTTSNKIIGVGGRDRSGKDTVAELLINAGYFGYSFGDAVRAHSRERHANDANPISVANMTETSNWLRGQFGPDVILKEALKAYNKVLETGEKYKGIVLYSVRAPVEVDFILEHGGQLVWVEANDDTRFQRRQTAHREGEATLTKEDMLAQEALQEKPQPGIDEKVQMNLNYVKDHATIVIENNGNDLEAFVKLVKEKLHF